MTEMLTPLSEEVKEEIVETQDSGIGIVLDEGSLRNNEVPADTLPPDEIEKAGE